MLPAPSSTRLVTIIAHVDHGKTTLADNLIESNGIISERLAGQLRYLDSDAEEQRRGITMRASAIGLRHAYLPTAAAAAAAAAAAGKTKNGNKSNTNNSGGKNNNNKSNSTNNKNNNATEKKDMVIHLIDSPGHVDFSAEVTSSLLLCDSALLVIDAVEGLCARTHSLLREAYVHQLVPVLVINKIDRLHLDLGLDLNEAYVRIRELIESVNAVCASMVHTAKLDNVEGEGEAQSKDSILDNLQIPVQTQKIRTNKTSETRSKPQSAPNTKSETQSLTEDELESIWNFDPIKGNVVFTSALHGWGFTIPTLARSLFKTKALRNTDPANLMKPPVLRQFLFGDYKYNWEKEKVFKWKQQGAGAEEYTMFAEFALKPLWEIYEGVSEATFSVGLKSELFTDGIHVPVVNGPNNYTNNANISTSNSSNKKLENTKIKATTLGMERVISSLQTGSTSPSIISNNTNNERKVPSTTDEMQQLLSRTGASSESSIVSAVLRRYRPLSDAVLDAVCETCPSPEDASTKFRTRALALRDQDGGSSDNDSEFKRIQESVRHCKLGEDVPTVAHVCKFTSTNRASVTDADLPPLPPGADPSSANMIMGIARVLSGTLRTEDVEYYMFGPRYTKSNDLNNAVPKQTIRCYLLMGSSFVRVSSVPAGHICAIYNLEGLQLKNVTICDRMNCMPLRGFDFGLQPLVKVNVEPVLASDTETLERGLLKLSLADASVEVTATSKGERILACLGEIHLERSILDLETVYCDHEIKLRISDPITSFCETTTWFENENDFDAVFNDKSPPLRQSTIPPYCYEEGLGYANRGRCRAVLSGRGAAIGIRAVPLPRLVYESLQNKKVVDGSDDELLMIGNALKCNADDSVLTAQSVLDTLLKSLCAVDANGNALFESNVLTMGYSAKAVQSSNGEIYIPRKEERPKDDEEEATIFEGMNEYNSTQTYIRKGLVESTPENSTTVVDPSAADMTALDIWKQDMRGSALAGFQLAMRAGPLCEEPVRGVAVILESVEIALTKRPSESDNSKQYRAAKDITGGIVVAALRSGIRCALLTRPARLVEGHLRLTLHSSLAGLGSLHAVLSKRRGKVVTDTMVDGTDLIRITATIPQAESFGLAPELLKKSSGEVTAPELVFSHWEVLDEDPFWIPTTEEEREDYGEILMNGDLSTGLDNNALKYIRMVRSRKGLMVDSSKIVVAAEKQRTLSRKK